jgi:membrane-associated phospholipid phosphatase
MEAIRRFGVNGTEVGDVPFPYIEDVKSLVDIPDCINSAGGKSLLLRGGRRSFPSGHTSFAFAGSTWCALYCFYWLSKLKSTMNLGMGGVKFPGASVSLGIFFLWFTPAIYVGISRTQVSLT